MEIVEIVTSITKLAEERDRLNGLLSDILRVLPKVSPSIDVVTAWTNKYKDITDDPLYALKRQWLLSWWLHYCEQTEIVVSNPPAYFAWLVAFENESPTAIVKKILGDTLGDDNTMTGSDVQQFINELEKRNYPFNSKQFFEAASLESL